jgi:hypothetical protein
MYRKILTQGNRSLGFCSLFRKGLDVRSDSFFNLQSAV